MDRAFSRRSFLKCTALTAVAIAGAGLLGGCKQDDIPVQTAPNTSQTVLQVTSKLNSSVYEDGKATFSFSIYNGRTNAIQVDRSSFSVSATNGYYAYKDAKINVRTFAASDGENAGSVVGSAQVKKGESINVVVEASDFPELASGETVTVTFFPDLKYSEDFARAPWTLTADKLTAPKE